MSWMGKATGETLSWLLEPSDAVVRNAALTRLVDHPDAGEESAARRELESCDTVSRLLEGQYDDGHWGRPERYFFKHTGTAWRWLLLHELGVNPQRDEMQRAARFLVDIAYSKAQGGFGSQPGQKPVPCYTGWLLWGFGRCGLWSEPRVQEALTNYCRTMRFDDGNEDVSNPDDGCYGRHTCYRGVVTLVRALADVPDALATDPVRRVLNEGVEFMLIHHAYKRSHNLAKPMNAKLTQLTFPGFYWPDLVDVLLVLTRMGIRDERMCDAIAYLRRKQARDGTWRMQRTYNERSKHDTFAAVVATGERGAPSKWVTLRALTVLKRWDALSDVSRDAARSVAVSAD